MFQLGNCNFNISAVVKYTKQEIELQERVCLWISCPLFRMSEASKLHVIDDNTLPSTGWKKHWDLIITSRFLYRKVWVMWTTSSPGWLPLNQSECVGCSVGLLVSLCSLQPHLLGRTLCCLAVLFGWLWPFRICGTKWTNQLPTLHAGLPHVNTVLSWDVGRFGDGSWKNYHSWHHHAPCFQTVAHEP